MYDNYTIDSEMLATGLGKSWTHHVFETHHILQKIKNALVGLATFWLEQGSLLYTWLCNVFVLYENVFYFLMR